MVLYTQSRAASGTAGETSVAIPRATQAGAFYKANLSKPSTLTGAVIFSNLWDWGSSRGCRGTLDASESGGVNPGRSN